VGIQLEDVGVADLDVPHTHCRDVLASELDLMG
jgi:hypothetical protein